MRHGERFRSKSLCLHLHCFDQSIGFSSEETQINQWVRVLKIPPEGSHTPQKQWTKMRMVCSCSLFIYLSSVTYTPKNLKPHLAQSHLDHPPSMRHTSTKEEESRKSEQPPSPMANEPCRRSQLLARTTCRHQARWCGQRPCRPLRSGGGRRVLCSLGSSSS